MLFLIIFLICSIIILLLCIQEKHRYNVWIKHIKIYNKIGVVCFILTVLMVTCMYISIVVTSSSIKVTYYDKSLEENLKSNNFSLTSKEEISHVSVKEKDDNNYDIEYMNSNGILSSICGIDKNNKIQRINGSKSYVYIYKTEIPYKLNINPLVYKLFCIDINKILENRNHSYSCQRNQYLFCIGEDDHTSKIQNKIYWIWN